MEYPTGLEVHDNVFAGPDAVIDAIRDHPEWRRSPVGTSPTESDIRTSESLFLPFISYSHPESIHQFAKSVANLLTDYAQRYAVQFSNFEPISFNRYLPGQDFRAHTDYFEGSNRVISAIAYLNTVNGGGMTNFIYHGKEVDAVAGRVTVFPSNYLFAHAALPPTTDTKYSAAFWVRG
ncbi:MAG: 2OG-Fe(II) oxygenase [Ilumatobacter sp.]|jgi:prolyl 4-hydroxylase|uniref:prolyl hydroxylase family protein n=1 Tax=Ilumatobacter sp. TaxID=1967498 RepID=UPI001DE162CE|nr:2OG-Fe(II) oxygenase [Ilumatobacter sp.]MBT5275252.1 2OG-Fe(II) oxygenase [Ilumatobacter sp.]MBT5552279.1 2OG-Fe(II) oxygenase [Ilumatobacter sp.]MBT5864758.1 2OG-Fe(II) oxygenase [Ilumatobacter sp.]MDG0975592.1 2OG-Fe(II) oxygenase [Ilumatobacter sp.]